MTDQADAQALASANHWQALLDSQDIADAAASGSVRRRLEDTLFEVLNLVRPFRHDGGYSGRVDALVRQKVAGLVDEYGPALGDHPLYRTVEDDPRHGRE